MNRIERIEEGIEMLRNELKHHELYRLLSEIDDIKVFMEKHVYAVWDFMSLLKALQNHLTCTSLPWKPVKNAKTARFINEIVFGEESDVNENNIPKSHFEMYLEAMQEVEADTTRVLDLVNTLNDITNIEEQLESANLKTAERDFLLFTFETIKSNEIHKIAAAFTFGREDLIPDMFIEIINQSSGEEGVTRFPKLAYYLERHIEVDGDEHGPLSLEMVTELCGDSDEKWDDALETAKIALMKRIELWDEIANEIKEKKEVYSMAM